jgi:hypothetical protein
MSHIRLALALTACCWLALAGAHAADATITVQPDPVGAVTSFAVNGATVNPFLSATVTAGTAVALSVNLTDPYLFTSWSATPAANATFQSATSPSTQVTAVGDVTVTASAALGFSLVSDTLPSAAAGTVSVSSPARRRTTDWLMPQNTPVAVRADPAQGYSFLYWKVEGSASMGSATTSSVNTVTSTGHGGKITATFSPSYSVTLRNDSRRQVYAAGFSKASQLELTLAAGSATGAFTALPAMAPGATSAIAYHRLGSDGMAAIALDGAQSLDGARVFFFVIDGSPADWPAMEWVMNAGATTAEVRQPAPMPQTTYPPYTFIEFTSKGAGLYLNASTVDGFFIPFTIQALTSTGAETVAVGQPAGVTRSDVLNAYPPFLAGLGATGDPYLALKQTPSGFAIESLVNPGIYLDTTSPSTVPPAVLASPLNRAFDDALTALFQRTDLALPQTWKENGGDKAATFSATAGQVRVNDQETHPALVFSARHPDDNRLLEYAVYNPLGFSVLTSPDPGGQELPITGTIAADGTLTFDRPIPRSALRLEVGMYLVGGHGASEGTTRIASIPAGDPVTAITLAGHDATPPAGSASRAFSKLPIRPGYPSYYFSAGSMVFGCRALMATQDGILTAVALPSGQDEVVIKGLQNQLVTALNRGVSANPCASWGDQATWYPTAAGSGQNLFSYFLHAATTSSGAPVFIRPKDAPATSARGHLMAMAYGFAYDEKPLTGPQVPSLIAPDMLGGASTIAITFGAWDASHLGSTAGGATGHAQVHAAAVSASTSQATAVAAASSQADDPSGPPSCGLGSGLGLLIGFLGVALAWRRRSSRQPLAR